MCYCWSPQVRYMKSDFEKRLSPKGIPTDVISMSDYGLMNGEKVLEQALDLLAQADKRVKQVVFFENLRKKQLVFHKKSRNAYFIIEVVNMEDLHGRKIIFLKNQNVQYHRQNWFIYQQC